MDGDGHGRVECGGDDCDDEDANRYPGNTEVCDVDDHDEDCNPETFGFQDQDSDGYIDVACCNLDAEGVPTCGDDCNDLRAVSHPGNTEACDGFDNDCNGEVDEGVLSTYYADADGDGYGSAAEDAETVEACSAPEGFAENRTDCDDGVAGVHPGAREECDEVDNDCNGETDPGCGCIVDDTMSCGTDEGECEAGEQRCDSFGSWGPCEGMRAPSSEVCNGLDDNCDGTVDDGVLVVYYADADGDGYGDPDDTTTACSTPEGYVASNTDCDDTDSTIHPGTLEICDEVDNNCDGTTDPGCGCTLGDELVCGSNVGECEEGLQVCTAEGIYGPCTGGVSPSSEICNGLDDDCDDTIDNGVLLPFYRDTDGDGYGAPDLVEMACGAPDGYVAGGTDCDDTDSAIHPGASEECDGVDNNCDETIDPSSCDCTNGDTEPCGSDTGLCERGTSRCVDGDWGPCEGGQGPVTEVCDGEDNDCDGGTDEDVLNTYYYDNDSDGYGDPDVTTTRCTRPSGYVTSDTDCDDSNGTVHPGASELCDRLDTDCSSGGGDRTIEDRDDDGHATTNTSICSGGPRPNDDCNEDNPRVHPGQTEYFNIGLCDSDEYFCSSIDMCCSDFSPCTSSFCGDANFDYNCDGVEERQPSSSGTCRIIDGTWRRYCGGTGPVYSGTPACGSEVAYVTCSYVFTSDSCNRSETAAELGCH